ncbi:MAG: glycosyltransferase family 2 protein [Ruminococcaceae bacterium]|nr:glycosyltransferase family 2 protein [Oscillospiraceae bacterium]
MCESKILDSIPVTVVIPVYKVEGTLEATVKSVQSQTHQNLEIILVDDGSPDKSGELCEKLALEDTRIKVIHQKNAGVSAARNAGIADATSDYICFVDSDDEIAFNFIEKSLKAICDSGAELAVCGVTYYHTNETCFEKKESCNSDFSSLSYEQCMDLFSDRIMPLCVSKIFSLDIIRKNNLRFPEGITCAEDGIFMYNYLLHCKTVSFLDIPAYRYYFYRSNSGSRTYSFESQKMLFFSKKTLLEKHCSEDDVKKYCAQKAVAGIRARLEYIAKKNSKNYDEVNAAFDLFLPYIIPLADSNEITVGANLDWFIKNKKAILNKEGKFLLDEAFKKRKAEKRAVYIEEFKKMNMRQKVIFIIKKLIP